MKNLFCTILIVLAFTTVTARAQKTDCPLFALTELNSLPEPGSTQILRVVGDEKSNNYTLKYNWTVSPGEIVDGQGTPTIKVLFREETSDFRATVTVNGLPENCNATLSESILFCRVSPIVIDEFSIAADRIDEAKLDYLTKELIKNPNSNGHIIEYFDKLVTAATIRKKIDRIRAYLAEKGFDRERVTVIAAEGENTTTRMFVVPPGAETPKP